ncbi:radical SAM protein [Kutzneria buriramensis]|nr:radical SAM protein [Kutzneria buriramensis]
MELIDGPNVMVWDMTYACPLRCTHCFTESGRRAPQVIGRDDALRITDAIISLQPHMISLCGGEPTALRHLAEVAERFAEGGVNVFVYTSGWNLQPTLLSALADVVTKIVVSVDGPNPAVHDAIRGRAGSFDRAMKSLAMIDAEAGRRVDAGEKPLRFGIDCVVIRSNVDHLEEFCTEVAPRFPHLESLQFGAVIPSGLASTESFVEHELPSDDQVAELVSDEMRSRLQHAAPATVEVETTENFGVQIHPTFISETPSYRPLEIEPDGGVRAMPVYEGIVGNLLEEDAAVLWRRARARWDDPFVLDTLRSIHTRRDWAVATRAIDYHFGSDEDRARIDKRPPHTPLPVVAAS